MISKGTRVMFVPLVSPCALQSEWHIHTDAVVNMETEDKARQGLEWVCLHPLDTLRLEGREGSLYCLCTLDLQYLLPNLG